MNDQPKNRKWFQFHLSTAIVLALVAGGLMWANFRPRDTGELEQSARRWEEDFKRGIIGGVGFDDFLTPWVERGWPATAYTTGNPHFYNPKWHVTGVLMDAMTALLVLFLAAVACERIIRQREVARDRQ